MSQVRVPVKEFYRQGGISAAILYKSQSKHGVLQVTDANRIRKLEPVSAKILRIRAKADLDIQAINVVFGIKP